MAKRKPEVHRLQDVLFSEEEVEKTYDEPTKTLKSEGMASCPAHYAKRETGLVRQGEHLVWRAHMMTTHAGTVTECRTSWIPICQPGARPRENTIWKDKTGRPAICPHDDDRYRR